MGYPGPVGGDLLARRYRLIDRVGAGGMSVVWRARDELLDRLVAVKWLDATIGGDFRYRHLVRREAWATARIKHPAIAAVYDYGEMRTVDGQVAAYVVMEMIDGESLAARIRVGPLPWREAVAVCAEIAEALATAHRQGVVHRDLTPENVMLTSAGVRVVDFGIAAQVGEPDDDESGSTFGTPTYIAPERLDGQPAQTATDVYTLGVLLFEALTGKVPFPEDAWDEDAGSRPRTAPRPEAPGMPAAVGRLCQQCLAYDPIQRPTAQEVAHRLGRYTRPAWRRRLAVAGVGAAVLITVGAGATLWHRTPPSDADLGASGHTPSASATAGTGTGTSAAPSATHSAGSKAPTTAPVVPPRTSVPATTTPPAPVTPSTAIAQLQQAVTAANDAGELRSDVFEDWRNITNSIAQNLNTQSTTQLQAQVADFRQKIAARRTDLGPPPAVTPAAADRIDAAAVKLQTALSSAQ